MVVVQLEIRGGVVNNKKFELQNELVIPFFFPEELDERRDYHVAARARLFGDALYRIEESVKFINRRDRGSEKIDGVKHMTLDAIPLKLMVYEVDDNAGRSTEYLLANSLGMRELSSVVLNKLAGK